MEAVEQSASSAPPAAMEVEEGGSGEAAAAEGRAEEGPGQASSSDEGSEDGSESEWSSAESVEALAPNRSRRGNAGAKMASLLNQEDAAAGADEFYAEAYGGFAEEDGDQEFAAHDSDSDQVDSDFDIDEKEPDPDPDADPDAGPARKRPRGVFTKAYKEPRPSGEQQRSKAQPRKQRPPPSALETSIGTRSLRGPHRPQPSPPKGPKAAKSPAARPKHRALSQAERLKEAAKTEKLNLASLHSYRELETAERLKRGKAAKRPKLPGPRVVELSRKDGRWLVFPSETELGRVERRLAVPKGPRACAVSGLPARYVDPLTKLPYHDAQAFRTIRQAYKDFLASDTDQKDVKNMPQTKPPQDVAVN